MVRGEYLVGGITGIVPNENAIIAMCCNLGNIISTGRTTMDSDEGESAFTGGIVGHNCGGVTRCANQGIISADYKTNGGIVGRNLRWYILLL